MLTDEACFKAPHHWCYMFWILHQQMHHYMELAIGQIVWSKSNVFVQPLCISENWRIVLAVDTIERPCTKSICKFMQVISKKSGFPVKDFTSSFADGQALCYLRETEYEGENLMIGKMLQEIEDFPALLPRTAIKIPRSSSFQQVFVLLS